MSISFLKVEGNRIVQSGANSIFLEMGTERIPPLSGDADYEQMIDMFGALEDGGQGYLFDAAEEPAVHLRDLLPAACPSSQVGELHGEHRPLELGHSVIVPNHFVSIPLNTSVHSDAAHLLVKSAVIRNDRSGIPVGAEVLAGEEAESGDAAEVADGGSVDAGEVSLTRILDDE